MARIRSIHPGFAKSGDIVALTKTCRLHFALLWTYADDHGKGKDDVRLIKAECWPLDDDVTIKKVEAMQSELATAGRLIRYEVDGKRYFQVVNWGKYQHPQKARPSEYPDVPVPVGLPETNSTSPVGLSPVVGEGEGEGEGEGVIAPPPAAPSRARPPDHLWEAVMAACGIQPGDITESSRGAYNRAVSDLRRLDVDPGEVRHRAAAYRLRWPDASLTPTALARHWAECSNGAAIQPVPSKGQTALMRAQARGQ